NHLSIILPAKNEAPALADLLPRLRTAHPEAEVIVVDDGSTDDTRRVCDEAGVACLSSPYSMGNGAAPAPPAAISSSSWTAMASTIRPTCHDCWRSSTRATTWWSVPATGAARQ